MTMTDIKSIDAGNLICVKLAISLWGGRQALKREHLMSYDPTIASLPPQALASMGSVKICDPEEVRVFQRIKNEALALLSDAGLPIFGADGIPKDKFDAIYLKLLDLQRKFEASANDLFLQYDTKVASWRAKWALENPGNAHLLGRIPDAQTVFGKLSFGFHCFVVNAPVADSTHHGANDQFVSQLKGLKGELFQAAAAEANDLLSKYLVFTTVGGVTSQKEKITQKTLRPFKRVASKLRSFSFVDPTAGPLADTIEWTLSQLPTDGPIVGQSLMSVWTLARLLADPVEAARVAEVSLACGPETAWEVIHSPAVVVQAPIQASSTGVQIERPHEPEKVTQQEGIDFLHAPLPPAAEVLFGNASSFL